MLKCTYTETGFHLEYLTQSLEDLITARFILALRLGDRLTAEPGNAAFLLPANRFQLTSLAAIAQQPHPSLSLSVCDSEFVEISLSGIWLTTKPDSGEGIFLASPGEGIEQLIWAIWQRSFSDQSIYA